jgi:hypothetical protein
MQPNGPLSSIHRASLDFTRRPPQFAPDAPLLVSCIRCRRPLSAAQPFEFNPVCPACAGPIRSVDA